MRIRTGLGECSHRFLPQDSSKPCMIGGLIFEGSPGFQADSDGDIIFHALCNAITTLTGVPVFGGFADDLWSKDGITDSRLFLEEALKLLKAQKISHIALALQGKTPFLAPHIHAIRSNIAKIAHLEIDQIGLSVTSGQGLTDVGCGEGMQCLALITTVEVLRVG